MLFMQKFYFWTVPGYGSREA